MAEHSVEPWRVTWSRMADAWHILDDNSSFQAQCDDEDKADRIVDEHNALAGLPRDSLALIAAKPPLERLRLLGELCDVIRRATNRTNGADFDAAIRFINSEFRDVLEGLAK